MPLITYMYLQFYFGIFRAIWLSSAPGQLHDHETVIHPIVKVKLTFSFPGHTHSVYRKWVVMMKVGLLAAAAAKFWAECHEVIACLAMMAGFGWKIRKETFKIMDDSLALFVINRCAYFMLFYVSDSQSAEITNKRRVSSWWCFRVVKFESRACRVPVAKLKNVFLREEVGHLQWSVK